MAPRRPMLSLYAIPVSLYTAKVRIVLRHKGLAWEEVPPPGGYGSDVYKTHVASGNLPALRDGDVLIADSEAIAEYLEEVHPEPAMLPRDPVARAGVREMSRFHDTRLEPALRRVFPYLPGRAAPPAGVVEGAWADVDARLSQLPRLPGFGAGATPTLGDCGFAITFEWIEAVAPLFDVAPVWPEAVTAYRARLAEMPAVAQELASYRPHLAAFLRP